MRKFDGQVYFFAALLLALGDAAALLSFTFIGTVEHEMNAGFWTIMQITLPFILGWWAAALLAGTYRYRAYAGFKQAAAGVIKTTILAMPAGLVLRYIFFGKPFSLTFAFVAFAFIVLFLMLWRLAFTWLIKSL